MSELNHYRQWVFLTVLWLACWPLSSLAADDDPSQRLLQMLDYVGVDYPPTVDNGQIIDPVEYAEMEEFSGEIVALLQQMPERPGKKILIANAAEIQNNISQRLHGDDISRLTQALKSALISDYNIVVGPTKLPDMTDVQALFESDCASCHGVSGHGDGPLAKGMEPQPGDFHDLSRQYTRSIYDLYNTITLGVPETPMVSFAHLSEEQRWALAMLVSRFTISDDQRAQGMQLWQQGTLRNQFTELADLTGSSYAMVEEWVQLEGKPGEQGVAVLAYLRSNPEELQISDHAALDTSIAMLASSVEHARNGDREAAHSAALAAYLDGFELAEPSLVVVDKQLKLAIEKEMISFREATKQGSVADLEQIQGVLVSLLKQAKSALNTTGLSSGAAFMGSFVILLREGVEAILVLAAIMAALIKTGRREAMRYIHIGWISAVLLGIVTWWIADNLIQVSGASRELTEGIAALVAAAILVYVGFWLHNASNSKRWKQFVEHKVGSAMEGGTLWALAVVAFLAVYREMFETVLFYQAMWVQIDSGSEQAFLLGIGAALALLVVLSLLIYKAGIKLPIKQFFQINAILLFLLAVVFTGQGIAALQEAGIVSTSMLNFPRIEVLGVYPTAQSLGLQLLVLIIGAGMLIYHKKAS
ncbi:MAG: cytochrome c/FTR1 family iron permease [Gammaproteobacteria bacterium]|nr:cytochrome c/FTR1 family iron permease [Gammaproteobacteria bacterium]